MNNVVKHIRNAALAALAISASAHAACISLGNVSDQRFNQVVLSTTAQGNLRVYGTNQNYDPDFPKGTWKCWCTTRDNGDMGITAITLQKVAWNGGLGRFVTQNVLYTPVGNACNLPGSTAQSPGGNQLHYNVVNTGNYYTPFAINWTGEKYCGFPYHTKPYAERPYAGTYCQLFY